MILVIPSSVFCLNIDDTDDGQHTKVKMETEAETDHHKSLPKGTRDRDAASKGRRKHKRKRDEDNDYEPPSGEDTSSSEDEVERHNEDIGDQHKQDEPATFRPDPNQRRRTAARRRGLPDRVDTDIANDKDIDTDMDTDADTDTDIADVIKSSAESPSILEALKPRRKQRCRTQVPADLVPVLEKLKRLLPIVTKEIAPLVDGSSSSSSSSSSLHHATPDSHDKKKRRRRSASRDSHSANHADVKPQDEREAESGSEQETDLAWMNTRVAPRRWPHAECETLMADQRARAENALTKAMTRVRDQCVAAAARRRRQRQQREQRQTSRLQQRSRLRDRSSQLPDTSPLPPQRPVRARRASKKQQAAKEAAASNPEQEDDDDAEHSTRHSARHRKDQDEDFVLNSNSERDTLDLRVSSRKRFDASSPRGRNVRTRTHLATGMITDPVKRVRAPANDPVDDPVASDDRALLTAVEGLTSLAERKGGCVRLCDFSFCDFSRGVLVFFGGCVQLLQTLSVQRKWTRPAVEEHQAHYVQHKDRTRFASKRMHLCRMHQVQVHFRQYRHRCRLCLVYLMSTILIIWCI